MPSLLVKTPDTFLSERRYVMDLIIKNWLGIEYEHHIWQEAYSQIEVSDNQELTLGMPDIFFQTPEKIWLTDHSLPTLPLPLMNLENHLDEIPLTNSRIPIIFGCNNLGATSQRKWQQTQPFLWENDKDSYLGIDIFGSAFFMLTLYEDYVKSDRDQHDRFPSTASLAYQNGFLDRPIINEYIEILWWCMKRLWPRLERKKLSFRTSVSHDVDMPFAQAFTAPTQLIRKCGGDIFKRNSLRLAYNRFSTWQSVKRGNYKQDPNYTFDRIMDISEQYNIKSAFYFKTTCTNTVYDDDYPIDHLFIRKLMREINSRGHEIGLHTSYETYQNMGQTKAEFQKLLQVCQEEGIHQDQWGGRQHFLRWKVPCTWRNWAEAGLNYDSSLSYAGHSGFRCGVCYDFPVFDLEQRKQLSLIERPLIIMEGSVLGEQYMGLNGQVALNFMAELKARCRLYEGNFTLLWHNSSFTEAANWAMYESLLKA